MRDTSSEPRRAPVAIFDLDGTLIDTAADVGRALNPSLAEHGLPELDAATSATLMGHGLQRFAAGAFARHHRCPTDADLAAFLARYTREPVVDTVPYPGVTDTLEVLANAGWQLAVCTNKVERLAVDILERLALRAPFRAVCGSDQAPARKPDPRHVAATLARAGLAGHPAVMIGDFSTDLDAARAFGIPGVFARWGYGPAQLGERATATADAFADLPELLARLVPAAS